MWTRGEVDGATKTWADLPSLIGGFLSKGWKANTPVAGANTGNGVILGACATGNSVAETWTITCTSTGPLAEFSVIGSVSGAATNAVVNNTYYSDKICFVLAQDTVDFIIGDSFTIDIVVDATLNGL